MDDSSDKLVKHNKTRRKTHGIPGKLRRKDQPQAEQEAPRRRVASGRQKADLVLKNATYVNVFCNELSRGDIAVAEGLIAGMGEHYEGEVEIDMGGKLVLPALSTRTST